MKITKIYYEPKIKEYELGRNLLEKYSNLPKTEIETHNNVEELRKRENKEFPILKSYLIIGTRKTHKYVENKKVSDYLVPFTSTGCTAMCLYCYLVCHFNKCSYLRVFVNVDEMLDKLIKFSNKVDKESIFEIGSNSDLILENEITNNLPHVIEKFAKEGRGKITFPTKFGNVDTLLDLKHMNKCIIRMSINIDEVIREIEIGTDNLENRIEGLIKLYKAGYEVGIIIAPVIMVENHIEKYMNLISYISKKLPENLKKSIFFEVIYMTYSYVHNEINKEAFKKTRVLLDKEKMRGCNYGKYRYKDKYIEEGKELFYKNLKLYFPYAEIKYIV